MPELDQQSTEALHEIIYCFQMLTLHRGGGARLVARDQGGYELYLMQLRKNPGTTPQLIEYENGKVKHTGEDKDLYRFSHQLAQLVKQSSKQPLVYQLDMHFDHHQRTMVDAAKLSWMIGNGNIQLGKLW